MQVEKKRSPYDFYPTPDAAIISLLDNYSLNINQYGVENNKFVVLEPCAGDGAIVKMLRLRNPKCTIKANELDEAHNSSLSVSGADKITYKDFLTSDLDADKKLDYIITNPPFSLGQEFLEHIFQNKQPNTTVIMLLRLNFLGSQKRHDFWQKYPPNQILVLSKRPSFTGHGTDSTEYAWFIWDGMVHKHPIKVV